MRQRATGPNQRLSPDRPCSPGVVLVLALTLAILSLAADPATAQEESSRLLSSPALPADLSVSDVPNDDGKALEITWSPPT